MQATALILAAGGGTRMRSNMPKVAFEMLGKPLVRWVVDAARGAGCDDTIVVLGHGRELVEPIVDDTTIVYQDELLGTGHAVMMAADELKARGGVVVVLSGDSPLIRPETLEKMMAVRAEHDASAVVLTFTPSDPFGYGRIVRGESGGVERIVEQKDCTDEEDAIGECNSGMYCFKVDDLLACLERLGNDNAQGEYYLTDVIGLLVSDGKPVRGVIVDDPSETHGINTRVQLAEATRRMQGRINTQLMLDGVTMIDPTLVWVGPDVEVARDVELWPMTFLMGSTSVGSGTRIGPNTRVTDTVIGEGCVIDESVVIEATIDNGVSCGPRAYLRPGAHLCENAKAGTHVEIKKSTIGKGSKVPHLSYIGDTVIGEDVNIGAGSITCNYDGKAKHKTVIGDRTFVGSDTMMVAPVTIGDDALIAAGSVITRDVPDGALGVARERQRNIEGYTAKREENDD